MNRATNTALKALAVCTALALTACAHHHRLHNTPNFRMGYADGCAAASGPGTSYRAGPNRDEALYAKDGDYRAGWNIGYSSCRSRGEPTGSYGNSVPIPGPDH